MRVFPPTASARGTVSDPSLRFAPACARGETPFRMTAYFQSSPAIKALGYSPCPVRLPPVPMSAPPRPFLLRFTLALLGMVLFMVVGFASSAKACATAKKMAGSRWSFMAEERRMNRTAPVKRKTSRERSTSRDSVPKNRRHSERSFAAGAGGGETQ